MFTSLFNSFDASFNTKAGDTFICFDMRPPTTGIELARSLKALLIFSDEPMSVNALTYWFITVISVSKASCTLTLSSSFKKYPKLAEDLNTAFPNSLYPDINDKF